MTTGKVTLHDSVVLDRKTFDELLKTCERMLFIATTLDCAVCHVMAWRERIHGHEMDGQTIAEFARANRLIQEVKEATS